MNSQQISVLASFLAAGVEFAVVGGVAVNVHGYLRATHDLDIFIRQQKKTPGLLTTRCLPWEFLSKGWNPATSWMMSRTYALGQKRITSTYLLRSARCPSIRFGETGFKRRSMG